MQRRRTCCLTHCDFRYCRAVADDPRQALFKYAEEAAKGKYFGDAYRESQPQRVLDQRTLEQEVEDDERARGLHKGDGADKTRH